MANRQNCSFDANIKCDDKYEFNEFYRQIKVAFESGKLTFCHTGTDICPCSANLCPRYLEGVAKPKPQITHGCPYDDTYCSVKAKKAVEFRERVHYLATNKINQVFIQTSDKDCPIDPTSCLRYQRYLNIVKKIKANEQQH